MLKAHIDFEGGAPEDLTEIGVHRWVEHPAVQCWLMSWRLGSVGAVQRWHPGDPDPVALLEHVRNGGIVVAHNAAFERWFWNAVVRRTYCPHWPALRLEQQECTLARCSALSIPAGLDAAAHVLGTQHTKDKKGEALMRKMARPRTAVKCEACEGAGCVVCDGCGQLFTWWDSPENIAELGDYCDQDVRAETDVDNTVLPLSERERRVWMLDQIINDRGITLDVNLIKRAKAVVEYGMRAVDEQMHALTGGYVEKASNVGKLTQWIDAQGVPCSTVAKGAQDDILVLADALGVPLVEQAIELRRERSKSSTAKLDKMLMCVCADGTAKGQLAYHKAHTGRKAGRLVQFQNLYRIDPEVDGNSIRLAIEILQSTLDPVWAHDQISLILGSPVSMMAKCMRSMIVARSGHKLVGGDLSNIEGCSNAWLSGEDWKVQAYLDYQAGCGPDLYRVAYARSFGVDLTTTSLTSSQRQLGKIQELALGYQGSVGAFYAFTQTYMMKLAPIVATVRIIGTREQWDRAEWQFERMPTVKRHGLSREVWSAMKIVVDGWRAANPAIMQSWWDMQDAAIEAMANPTVIVPCLNNRIKYMANKGFLWCQLPSSRLLAYPKAHLVWKDDSTITLLDGTVEEAYAYSDDELDKLIAEGAEYKKKVRRQVLYEGYSDDAGVWMRKALYGGQQSENVNSGIARDILVDCAFDLEDAGYPIILDVHDELLAEPLIDHGSAAEMQTIMSRPRAWAPGFPLAAKAWEGPRYDK